MQRRTAPPNAAKPTPKGPGAQSAPTAPGYGERKRLDTEARRLKKQTDARRKRVEELEARIADREQAIKDIEDAMSAPGFYDDRETSKPVIDRHQTLMWEVGDLMNQWELLQTEM